MDWYQYYLRRMSTRKEQVVAIEACKELAIQLFEVGPLPWAVESGSCFLAALNELDIGGIDVLPAFTEVEQALFAAIQEIRLGLETSLLMKIQNTGCGRTRNGDEDCKFNKGGKRNA